MKKYSFLFLLLLILYNFNLNNIQTSNSSFFIYPTSYTSISSNFGNRILYNSNNFHNGIDFLAPQGSEVYASNSGYITYASFLEDGYGNTIIITHSNSTKSLYCHLSEDFIVSVGQYVNIGDTIGYVGPKYLSNGNLNGNTTGPHLHFSVFINDNAINPLEVLE